MEDPCKVYSLSYISIQEVFGGRNAEDREAQEEDGEEEEEGEGEAEEE